MLQWHPIEGIGHENRITEHTRILREPAGNRQGYIYRIQYRHGPDRDWIDATKPKTYTNPERAMTAAINLEAQIKRELKGWGV